MKNLRYIFIILFTLVCYASCSDELDDELFHKFAYMTTNGWTESKLDVKTDNTAELGIYIGINGTSENDTDVVIELEVDLDTLVGYNFDKFKNQVDAYYSELPSVSYTFDKTSYKIPAGEIKTAAKVLIDMNKIDDLYREYVLPVKIKSASGVGVGPSKYSKILANILFTNEYSGDYTGSATIKEADTSQSPTSVSGTRFYATSVSSCFFYAGNVTRSNTSNYGIYAIDIKFGEDGSIVLSTKNTNLSLNVETATMTRKYSIVNTDSRYYSQQTTIVLKYRYNDLSTGENRVYEYSGTINISKNVLKGDYPNVTVEE